MPLLSKILLPVDFSERCAGAARHAQSLAERFASEIVLLHVVAPAALDIGGSMIDELYRVQTASAQRELSDFRAARFGDLNVRVVVREGDPSLEIVSLAHAENVGLILMPTHGYGPFRRFILGSSTAKVLHDAECPVWTGVHLGDHVEQPLEVRQVLCAVDLGPQSQKTSSWAAWLAAQYGAKLSLLHVAACPPGSGPPEAARTELKRLSASGDVLLGTGDPPKVICEAAENLSADVLVIGRGSAAGSFGRLRTNAYAIIRQSPCPVVSV